MQEFLTKVTSISYLTMDVVELRVILVAPDFIEFEAGQFMQLKIGDQLRAYSIAAPPLGEDHDLSFLIQMLPGGVGSEFVRNLKKGDEVVMRGPLGILNFTDFNRKSFFVAAGVGVAPFASVLPTILTRGYEEDCRLLFGLRSEEDVFYFDKFQNLAHLHRNFQFIPVLSQPKSHWPGQVGRVTTFLEIYYPQHSEYKFYVCGGQDMVNDTREVLIKRKHDPKDIRTEIFTHL